MMDLRHRLPQLGGDIFLTDAGIETTLIFQEGLDLPHFAAFHLLRDEKGKQALRDYYCRHAGIARKNGTGFILESATWRASPDWGDKLGYSAQALDGANRKAIALLRELKAEFETERSPMIISGCIGPRGDGYDPGKAMSPEQAQAYHARQTGVFADAGVDLVTANTMTNMNEAIGVTRTELDDGNPIELGLQYRDLRRRFGHINVLGGCCGTDHRHIEQICTSCMEAA